MEAIYLFIFFTNTKGLELLGPFYGHASTSIPIWISDYIHYKMWDEITYPFLNVNVCTVEVRQLISNSHYTLHLLACDYLSML